MSEWLASFARYGLPSHVHLRLLTFQVSDNVQKGLVVSKAAVFLHDLLHSMCSMAADVLLDGFCRVGRWQQGA